VDLRLDAGWWVEPSAGGDGGGALRACLKGVGHELRRSIPRALA